MTDRRQSVLEEIAHREASLYGRTPGAASVGGFDPKVIAPLVWAYFRQHEHDKIWTVRVWIITKTFTWGDLRPVLTAIFGPDPMIGHTTTLSHP